MKSFKYIIIIVAFLSCDSNKKDVEANKYQILNLLYSSFSKEQLIFFNSPVKGLPPVSLNSVYQQDSISNIKLLKEKIGSLYKGGKKDSLEKENIFLQKKENQQIYAFVLRMKKYHRLSDKKKVSVKGFDDLFKKFASSKRIDSLDIHRILPVNNDSITVFSKDLLEGKVGVGFRAFDVLISFSNIVFSDNHSKAIVIGTRSFSGTDSHSLLFFLEKDNGKWRKIFEQLPSISQNKTNMNLTK